MSASPLSPLLANVGRDGQRRLTDALHTSVNKGRICSVSSWRRPALTSFATFVPSLSSPLACPVDEDGEGQ